MPTRLRAAPPLACVLAFAGCVTQPLPPTLSLKDRTCGTDLPVAQAQPLALGSEGARLVVDATTPCIVEDGNESAVIVLNLPESAEPYLLSISSLPRGTTLFSPRLSLLDAAGSTLREIPRSAFAFRGAALNAGLRARPDERFLVIRSDPQSVGRKVDQIVGETRTVATGYFTVHTGSESVRNLVFSHNGEVTVQARAAPKAG